MAKTTIEWTERNWNPFYGCKRKSPGCENCYAEQIAGRFSGADKNGKVQPYAGIATKTNGVSRWTGEVKLNEEILLEPLKIKKPTTFFVNSMSDTFYEKFPDEWIDKLFAVMALCPQHTFQILTKRADRMRDYFVKHFTRHLVGVQAKTISGKGHPLNAKGFGMNCDFDVCNMEFPLPNVWLGVSCENQKTADERIPHLLETPAAIRFLSCEPLLGEIKFKIAKDWDKPNDDKFWMAETKTVVDDWAYETIRYNGIRWVIVGGESGNGARPCNIAWIRSIVEQCRSATVACFVKQLGSVTHWNDGFWSKNKGKGADFTQFNAEFPAEYRLQEFPKQ